MVCPPVLVHRIIEETRKTVLWLLIMLHVGRARSDCHDKKLRKKPFIFVDPCGLKSAGSSFEEPVFIILPEIREQTHIHTDKMITVTLPSTCMVKGQ